MERLKTHIAILLLSVVAGFLITITTDHPPQEFGITYLQGCLIMTVVLFICVELILWAIYLLN